MEYVRKTKDVWNLWWNGECIDTFDTFKEAKEMKAEYNLAFHGGVTIRAGRERLL